MYIANYTKFMPYSTFYTIAFSRSEKQFLTMAEGPDPVVADLEQEVTCGICHDRYQEPKLLPCCHYYCKQCILTLSSRYRPNQPFPCPDCREPTLLPGNNLDRLPTAFVINRMKALHSRMEKAYGKYNHFGKSLRIQFFERQ